MQQKIYTELAVLHLSGIRIRSKMGSSQNEANISSFSIQQHASRRALHQRRLQVYKFLQLCGLCMLLIFLNTCAWVADKKLHGEDCVSSDECNERELLSCGTSGKCSCSSTSFLYDKDLERCVARVGEKCGSAALRGDLAFPVSCVDGAICDESSGGCVCTDDYFRLINRTCTRKRKYMEICESDNECSKDIMNARPLVCHDGFCTCDPVHQFYDTESKHCVTLVGQQCNIDLAKYRNECTRNAICMDGLCVCGEGFARNGNGACGTGHGSPCTGKSECSDLFYQCLEGKCECKYLHHQIFDSKTGECLSLVGGPCTINITEESPSKNVPLRCTRNAICTDLGFYGSCECMDGFVQRSATGECVPGFGVTCEALECDPITPLFCKNGRCGCEDELQFYDVSRRRCLGMVGTRCNPKEMNQCVQFASCIQVGAELEGRCICDRYAQEVENRTCIYNET